MNEKDREQIALFRFSLISPLLNGQALSQSEYLSSICSKVYDVPYYGRKEFAPKTISHWARSYRKFGFDGLKPKSRDDKGNSRALSLEQRDLVLNYRKTHAECSATLFYEKLISAGIITLETASYHTVYRLLKYNKLLITSGKPSVERKRFAYNEVNVLWQGDMSVGPYINAGGRKLRTNLFCFIDDCSRIIPYAEFFFTEKFEAMAKVLKESILRRGIPKIIYVDNGKIYRAEMLNLACAELGISLAHTQPYDPQSKGKIERFFGTVRRRFYPLLKEDPVKTLDELNQKFSIWLEEDYHRKVHSSLGISPLEAFMNQIRTVKMYPKPAELDPLFWKRDFRKVHIDSTISVQNKLFEVPMNLIGDKIEIRYDPAAPQSIYIFENGKPIYTTKAVIFEDNAKTKRAKNIDPDKNISFSEIFISKGSDS